MALKIWKDGAMKKIDTNLHKPVIFINGDKYKLDKAYTFVNGQKQLIWGESGVQIDYISSTGILGGGVPFAISENWVNVWNNNTIYRLDISNLTSPSLIQNLEWGAIKCCSYYQSTNSNAIFASWQNKTGRKISMDVNNGSMSVIQTSTISATYSGTTGIDLLGITNSDFVSNYRVLQQLSPITIWQNHIFWNGVEKYTDSIGGYGLAIQIDNNNILVRQRVVAATSDGIYTFSDSGKTQIGTFYGKISDYIIYDSDEIYYCSNLSGSNNLVKASANDVTVPLEYITADENRNFYLFGKIGNYLYCLDKPTTNTVDSIVKFKLLDSNDLSVVYEKVLPNDPFNENSGLPTFWINATCIPQVSNTNFVGIGTYNSSTLGLRIVRFSGLI